MAEAREYRIDIDPRILELLGPSLYTNIYFVLAELIANAYDADAKNVYILQKEDSIIVEDDGSGMSYSDGDIEKYLKVAVETRADESQVYTNGDRKRMGRKGVGKLAALSVSENVSVRTRRSGESSGFVLSRNVGRDGLLKPLDTHDITFEKIEGDGTSILMPHPQYDLHKTPEAVKRNILKIFPLINRDFRVHITTQSGSITAEEFDKEVVRELGALITFGEEFADLKKLFDSKLDRKEEIEDKLVVSRPAVTGTLTMRNKDGIEGEYEISVVGWLGAYRTTRDRKKDHADFPDNFISLFSNAKLGEYNILPAVGKNRLPEVYVVGQLHIDLFEETSLPDMALSNRQGYKSDDPRYQFIIKTVREELLPQIIAQRELYGDHQRKLREEKREAEKLEDEAILRERVEEFNEKATNAISEKIGAALVNNPEAPLRDIIREEIGDLLPIVGIKRKVDSQKRKILISHSSKDKSLADLVYKMLLFNGIPSDEIIYTSADDEEARIPEGTPVLDYLRNFFINSYSDQKIFVVYVTSDVMARTWFAVTEVGAGWIARSSHKVFNIKGHRPQEPLDTDVEWHTSEVEGDVITLRGLQFDKFIIKIRSVAEAVGYAPKTKEDNSDELKRFVTIAK